MGNPSIGDLVDNVLLFTEQIRLKGSITGVKGDFLVPESATSDFWILAPNAADMDTILGFAQSRVDFDTTGLSDGEVEIEALFPPSSVFALSGEADITPGHLVKLDSRKFVKWVTSDLPEEIAARYIKEGGDNVNKKTAGADEVGIYRLRT